MYLGRGGGFKDERGWVGVGGGIEEGLRRCGGVLRGSPIPAGLILLFSPQISLWGLLSRDTARSTSTTAAQKGCWINPGR